MSEQRTPAARADIRSHAFETRGNRLPLTTRRFPILISAKSLSSDAECVVPDTFLHAGGCRCVGEIRTGHRYRAAFGGIAESIHFRFRNESQLGQLRHCLR